MTIPPAPVHEGIVERGVLNTLKTWMRTYLGFAESWYGYPAESLPDIAGWAITDRVDMHRWPEDQIPCIILHCDGHADMPREDADGSYSVDWAFRIGVVVATAAVEGAARDMARVYSSAVRSVLVFHGLTGVNGTIRWTGGDPYPPAEIKGRTLAGAENYFTASISAALTRGDVPTTPIPDPPGGGRPDYPGDPTAETVNVTVTQL